MEKVLVSACLLGDPVRHNGAHKKSDHEILQRWIREGRVVPICPEVAGGLPVPRPPAEIVDGAGGAKVLAGESKVLANDGRDVSSYFVDGAHQALALARTHGIRVAVLKEGSPSCGSGYIYDGTFTSTRVVDAGVTAAILRGNGVRVFSELEFAAADSLLDD